VVEAVAALAAAVRRRHPVRVGIDGVDAAGKTTFADELAAALVAVGRRVVRASIDDFLPPRAVRYARGRRSAEGYYRDGFDLVALRRELLEPLGPGGDRRYRARVFDYVTDSPRDDPVLRAPRDAVAVVDGVFLHRPELEGCFDLTVFLEVDLLTALTRGAERNPAAQSLYRDRYQPAQRRYLAEVRPHERADVVIENSDAARPRILRTLPAWT
jgi:uridine kinase